MEDRPPPSATKLLGQFRDWVGGTEQPGRTMSYLKTGYLPEVLDATESATVPSIMEAWNLWERGETNPTSVLESMRDQGLEALLVELAES